MPWRKTPDNTGVLDNDQPGVQRTSFIPKLESKYAAATTPAKRPLASSQSETMMSPPLMVLKDMGVDASSDEFRAAASFNIEELHTSQLFLSQELQRNLQATSEQSHLLRDVTDKVNVIAGLMGVPMDTVEVPTVWQAITLISDHLCKVTTHLGTTIHRIAQQNEQSNGIPLL
ncbi:hypothetical protein ACA910_013825 [Epithemia clementina (nom. ined.)]